MSYTRVLPRDLFNEANFLKCIGKFWIETESRSIFFNCESVDDFGLDLDPDSGGLISTRLSVSIWGNRYLFFRPMNSRDPYPLYLIPDDPKEEEIPALTESGRLSKEVLFLLEENDQ